MKKNLAQVIYVLREYNLKKVFRIMKISTFLFFLLVLQMHAETVFSQDAAVELSKNSLTLNELIRTIEDQTDYLFIFSKSDINVDRVVSVSTSSEKVSDVLQNALEGSGVTFHFSNNYITLRKKVSEESGSVSAPQQSNITVTGVVEDALGPVIGANVVEKGTTNGTISDVNGKFSLTVAPNAVLVVSYIGYVEQQIPVNNRTSITVQLREDTQALDEVIVVGYSTMKKKDLTGAVSVVKVDEIENRASTNVMQSLQGRVPGVFITSTGSPDGAASVMIRGVSTLGAHDPLYIIDGMPSTEGMSEVAPQDIESIQVLKDASSASIYGSRAANGVIIITTKKGDRQRTTVSARASLTIRNYSRPLDWLNTEERGRIQWQAARNDGNDPNRSELYQFEDHQDANGNWVLDKVLWPEFIDSPYNTMRSSDTDWVKEVGQTAVTQNYNLNVSTGGKNGRSLFSLDYLNNRGTIKETFNERYSARFNSDYTMFNGRLTVAENFSITKSKRSRLDAGGILTNTREIQPIVPVHTVDGEGWGGPWGSMGDRKNPVRIIEQSKGNDNHVLRMFGDASITLEPIKNLYLKTVIGIDYTFFWYRNMFLPYKEGYLKDDTPVVTNRDDRYGNWVWTNTANYNFNIKEDHQFTLLAGQEMMKYGWERVEAERKNFADLSPDYMYLDLGETNQRAAGSATNYALLSYFGKVNYNYLNRYLASFTLRYDGSSRFGKNNRFATFPAFSLGWRMSEEDFFKKVISPQYISDLKLRYGWGQTGYQNMANNYASWGLYEARYSSDWASGGNYFTGTAYDIKGIGQGTLASGYRRMQLANPDLKWETATQNNFGLDFGFLDNQFTGSFDYFIKNTKDILVAPPVLAVLGEGSVKYINGAAMKNTGFEFMLSYSKKVGDLLFNVTGNIGAYRNKITELPEDVWDAYPGNAGIGDVILGHPLNSYYGYVADGLFQSEAEVADHAEQTGAGIGRIRFRDIDGDGKITTDDRTWIGVADPDFVYGLNFSAAYKQWDFSMFWNGVSGGTANVQSTKLYTDFYGAAFTGENNGKRTLDAWSPTNTKSTIPMLSAFDNNSERELSSYYMESASYLKLRSVELGYTLAKSLADKLSMQNARIYMRGDNLLKLKKTWGDNAFTGADPETPNTAYPIPFSISFGVNVSF